MTRTGLAMATVLSGLWVGQVRGDLIVDFAARDEALNEVTGPVPVGTVLLVDVLISVTAEDNPQSDVRLIQLDFSDTSPNLETLSFVWKLDPGVSDGSYLKMVTLPKPLALYIQSSSVDGFILDFDDTPQIVGTLEVKVNASGDLTIQTLSADNPNNGTVISVGFSAPRLFASADGNISGGTLTLQVIADSSTDSDGDGSVDIEDDFPNDPDEQTDTDGDQTGNNADDDDDDDGTPDEADDLPLDPADTADTDADGVGNSADEDDDNDGVPDVSDAFPEDPDRTGGGGSGSGGGGNGGSGNGSSGGGATTFCGAGILMPAFFLLLGLTSLRVERHSRGRPARSDL